MDERLLWQKPIGPPSQSQPSAWAKNLHLEVRVLIFFLIFLFHEMTVQIQQVVSTKSTSKQKQLAMFFW